jgi:hypothetical protein
MLRRILNIFIAASLVLLMMLSGVAHEFVHSFIGHEDTIDHVQTSKHRGGVSFEQEHHHCDFLQFPSPVFLFSSFQLQFHPALAHTENFLLADLPVVSRPCLHTALRGPPVCG